MLTYGLYHLGRQALLGRGSGADAADATDATALAEEELALVHQAKGELEEAEPLLRSALAARRRVLAGAGTACVTVPRQKALLQCVSHLATLLRVQAEAHL